mgnify:CR=1 FL=1
MLLLLLAIGGFWRRGRCWCVLQVMLVLLRLLRLLLLLLLLFSEEKLLQPMMVLLLLLLLSLLGMVDSRSRLGGVRDKCGSSNGLREVGFDKERIL